MVHENHENSTGNEYLHLSYELFKCFSENKGTDIEKKILKDKREKSRIEALKKKRTEVYSFNILSIMHTKKVNSK